MNRKNEEKKPPVNIEKQKQQEQAEQIEKAKQVLQAADESELSYALLQKEMGVGFGGANKIMKALVNSGFVIKDNEVFVLTGQTEQNDPVETVEPETGVETEGVEIDTTKIKNRTDELTTDFTNETGAVQEAAEAVCQALSK